MERTRAFGINVTKKMVPKDKKKMCSLIIEVERDESIFATAKAYLVNAS